MDAIDDFEIDAENCKDIDINEKLAKTVEFVVDNAEPSQLGGISVYSTRKAW